ncbi:hypothetical protein COU60_00665 [Candidatus Pacearchaeota archaeon CG10_big_fil_rev_8_21_14_0_10_34_76]|nr:MAG: hypothetical protein COU60_00665 [Candidatus Pacearchaeota archaeon CG10_big_fil_rev_8_21_14_0_10_34_76]
MILVIRISGIVKVSDKIEESMNRINLRRKYSATLIEDTPENRMLLTKIRNFVAFGDADDKLLEELIEKRGESTERKKIDAKEVVGNLAKKGLKSQGMKPFFRLHPPRGGIDSKKHFGVDKGVLGDHKDKIGNLVRRML